MCVCVYIFHLYFLLPKCTDRWNLSSRRQRSCAINAINTDETYFIFFVSVRKAATKCMRMYIIMCVLEWWTVLCSHRRVISVFISRVAQWRGKTKLTLEWAHKQFLTRVQKKRRSPHIVSVSYSLGLLCADNVANDRWWRHHDYPIVTQSRE